MDVGVRSSRIVMAPGTPMSAMKEATPRSGTKLPTRCTAPRSPDDSPEKILGEEHSTTIDVEADLELTSRVTMVVVHLGCVDSDLRRYPGWWAAIVAAYCPTGGWNIPNLSQLNPGAGPPWSP